MSRKAALTAYRGELVALTPSASTTIDGQQLLRSSRNGNYYLRINGDDEPVMLSMFDAAGWLTLHGYPQFQDTQIYVNSLTRPK